MKKFAAVACVLGMAGAVLAADLESGLPVGESVPAFNVRDVTGPNKGKTLCYRCQYGSRPVVAVFTRTINDDVVELVKKVDEKVAENKDAKMAAFVILLTEDADSDEAKLEKIAAEKKIANTPLTIIEGSTGPENYKISKDAEVTVMMWVESEVKVNAAFEKGKFDKKAAEKLVAETKKILD